MKIVVVCASSSPWAPAVVKNLAATGTEVHLAHVFPPKEVAYHRARIEDREQQFADLYAAMTSVEPLILRGGGLSQWLHCAYLLRKTIKRVRPDGVLSLYGGGLGLATYLAGHRPYSVYVVGSDVLRVSNSLKPLSQKILEQASIVFANGDALADAAKALAPSARIQPLLMGIDCDEFVPPASLVPTPPVKFVCARGFLEIYNNEQIIRAALALPHEESWELTFVAGGPLLDRAKELAAPLGPRVRFLGGIPTNQMVSTLQQHHFAISMSRSDGASTSVLESAAVGLPLIASDIPANRALQPALGSGFTLVPLDDVRALTTAMREAVRSVGERRTASELHDSVRKIADGKQNMSRLLSLLRQAWSAS